MWLWLETEGQGYVEDDLQLSLMENEEQMKWAWQAEWNTDTRLRMNVNWPGNKKQKINTTTYYTTKDRSWRGNFLFSVFFLQVSDRQCSVFSNPPKKHNNFNIFNAHCCKCSNYSVAGVQSRFSVIQNMANPLKK